MNREELLHKLINDYGMATSGQDTIKLRGYDILIDIPTGSYLLLAVGVKPRHKLLISPSSEVTKQLDALGIGKPLRSGQREFDDKYVVRTDVDSALAHRTLQKLMKPLSSLGSFIELELTNRDYRLLLAPPENLDQVVSDLKALTRVIDATECSKRVPTTA